MTSKQIDIESLYAEEVEPRDTQAGITLTEFVEGFKELRRRTQHNGNVSLQTNEEQQRFE